MRAFLLLVMSAIVVLIFVIAFGSPVRDAGGVFTPATCPGCEPVEVDL